MVIGQPGDMLEQVLDKDGRNCFFGYDKVNHIQQAVTRFMGLYGGATGGVGWNEVGDTLWDMYQCVRYRLAWDHAEKEGLVNSDGSRNWSTMMGVSYDKPMGYGSEPLVEIHQSGDGYRLTMNDRQALLLEEVLKTVLEASVCRFELAAKWPKSRENGSIEEVARQEISQLMAKVACLHIGIAPEDRQQPEQSPIAGDVADIMGSMREAPRHENDLQP